MSLNELLTPDLSKVDVSDSLFNQISSLTTQPFLLYTLILLIIIPIFWSLLIGFATGTKYKRTIERGNFWLLFLSHIISIILLVSFVIFPFWALLLK